MDMIRLILSIAVVALSMLAVGAQTTSVKAVEDTTDTRPTIQRPAKPMESTRPKAVESSTRSALQRETGTANREATTTERCERARTAITTQMTKLDQVKDDHGTKFSKFVTHLDLLIEKLDDRGVDTTKLVADKEKLEALILEYDSALELYLQKIDAAKALAPNCGTSQGEFLTALKDARTQMQVVRSKAQAVRVFIQTTIKVDLAAVKRAAEKV